VALSFDNGLFSELGVVNASLVPQLADPSGTVFDNVPYADAQIIEAAEPDFPEIAYEQDAQGTTIVKVTIGAGGRLLDAKVQVSSGNLPIDRASLASARRQRYSPARYGPDEFTADYAIMYSFSFDYSALTWRSCPASSTAF
jgi:protein TonB